MSEIDILVFLTLIQVKHYLADFQWQTSEMIAHKDQYLHPAGLAHAGLHAVLSIPVLVLSGLAGLGLIVLLALGEFFVHHHIDWTKARRQKDGADIADAEFWQLVGLDQAAHQLTYACMLAICLA